MNNFKIKFCTIKPNHTNIDLKNRVKQDYINLYIKDKYFI